MHLHKSHYLISLDAILPPKNSYKRKVFAQMPDVECHYSKTSEQQPVLGTDRLTFVD